MQEIFNLCVTYNEYYGPELTYVAYGNDTLDKENLSIHREDLTTQETTRVTLAWVQQKIVEAQGG
jgi:hypothetical protein